MIHLIKSHSLSTFLIGSLALGLYLVFLSFKLFMVRVFIEKEKECQLPIMLDQFWIKCTLASDLLGVKSLKNLSSIKFMYIRSFNQVVKEFSQQFFFLGQRWNRDGSIRKVGVRKYIFDRRT